MSQYVAQDTTWADYADQKQKEQLWIHQSTINSLLYDVTKTLAGEGFNKQMFSLLQEVYFYYGPDVSCEGILSFPFEKDSQPVTVDVTKGLVIGNEKTGMTTNIKLMCAENDTTAKELAVDLTTGLYVVANFTWDNFEYWASLSDPKFMDTVVTSPVVNLDYHNWNAELTAVL